MLRTLIQAVMVFAVFMIANPVAAESKGARSCPQALAAYGSPEKALLLEFSGGADLGFRVVFEGSDWILTGHLFPGENDGDDQAVLLDNCPEGDVTGEELDACTIWQGAIYARDAGAARVTTPKHNESAAGILVLEGLADVLVKSEQVREHGLSVEKFEQLTLLACQE